MTAASTARGINEWILARYIGQSFDITLMNGARLASSGEGGQGMLNKISTTLLVLSGAWKTCAGWPVIWFHLWDLCHAGLT